MPAIDLARLRKQANRLADFFFLPDEFMKRLRETLDFYVNYTLRTAENVAPGSNLKTYRTPPAVLTQIENELRPLAEANPQFALDLADRLWDEGALETRLLAAFLLGRIPPQEERLLPRLTAWTQQVRDPNVRSALLSTSLTRMRRETPAQFLTLVREYLHPARARTWANGIQALLPMIAEAPSDNLPTIFDMIEPIIEEAPSTLQDDLTDLIVALYRAYREARLRSDLIGERLGEESFLAEASNQILALITTIRSYSEILKDYGDLSDAERHEFLEAMGIHETGLEQVIHKGYHALGLISFFTAGPKEVRAWTIRRGTVAREAAGA
jgi:signal transduction histidine kinase